MAYKKNDISQLIIYYGKRKNYSFRSIHTSSKMNEFENIRFSGLEK